MTIRQEIRNAENEIEKILRNLHSKTECSIKVDGYINCNFAHSKDSSLTMTSVKISIKV